MASGSSIEEHLRENIDDTEELVEYLGALTSSDREEATQVALEWLASPDEKLCADALWFIELLRPDTPAILPALLMALNHSNLYTRSHAAVYLAEAKLAPVTSELVAILKNEEIDSQTRARAAIVLGHQGGSEAIKALITSLDDRNPEIVWNVIHALGIAGNPDARTHLERIHLTDKRTTPLGHSLAEEADQAIKYCSNG